MNGRRLGGASGARPEAVGWLQRLGACGRRKGAIRVHGEVLTSLMKAPRGRKGAQRRTRKSARQSLLPAGQ